MMKSVLVAIVLWVAWFVWRKQRSAARKMPPKHPSASPAGADNSTAMSQDMVKCPVCGVHVPQSDTLPGRAGAYCSDAHRQQAEG